MDLEGAGKGDKRRIGANDEAYRKSPLWDKIGPDSRNKKLKDKKLKDKKED